MKPTSFDWAPLKAVAASAMAGEMVTLNIPLPEYNEYIRRLKPATIRFPKRETEIGECAFKNCDSLTSISISDSVTKIGGSAFSGCSSLESIAIPDSVTSIGHYAFSNSGIRSIEIPSSVGIDRLWSDS